MMLENDSAYLLAKNDLTFHHDIWKDRGSNV
jgi:hypothetical protein